MDSISGNLGYIVEDEEFQPHLANAGLPPDPPWPDTYMGHRPMRHDAAPEGFAAEAWQT